MVSTVSIVVPIYNASKTIEKCLDSIQRQSYRDIEIICVDDGSSDNSIEIVSEYAQNDTRIKLFEGQHLGVTAARKKGVSVAQGQYIGFVDADDWIEPIMFEKLVSAAIENDADFVSSGYFFEGDYTSFYVDGVPTGVYEGESLNIVRESLFYNVATKEVGIRSVLWTKLFNKERFCRVIKDFPDEITFAEDKMMIVTYLLESSKICIIDNAFYHYVKNGSSIVNSEDMNYLAKINSIYVYLNYLFCHPNFSKGMRKQAELYITDLMYKGINYRMGFENKFLLWVDPYWMNAFDEGTSIVLYGPGDLSDCYMKQVVNNSHLVFCGRINRVEQKRPYGEKILGIEEIFKLSYDYVVITIKNKINAREEENFLISKGIPKEKIKWFEQEEVFWRFAEASGWF